MTAADGSGDDVVSGDHGDCDDGGGDAEVLLLLRCWVVMVGIVMRVLI